MPNPLLTHVPKMPQPHSEDHAHAYDHHTVLSRRTTDNEEHIDNNHLNVTQTQTQHGGRSVYEKVFPLKARTFPSRIEAPSVSEWLTTYTAAMFSVSVFGGSITFTVVVSDLFDPSTLPTHNRATFSLDTIRLFIALGWMFFTFSFGISAITLVLYNNESLKYVPRHRWGFVEFMLKLMLPILSLTPILAFACLALAVAAYAPVVGWFVLGWIGLYFAAVVGLIIYVQSEGVSFLILPENKGVFIPENRESKISAE